MGDELKVPDGYTRGTDLRLSDLRRGDTLHVRDSRLAPHGLPLCRLHGIHRVNFSWEDGQECGKPGEERLWVRKSPLAVLQSAVVARDKVLHVVSDPSLPPYEPPVSLDVHPGVAAGMRWMGII